MGHPYSCCSSSAGAAGDSRPCIQPWGVRRWAVASTDMTFSQSDMLLCNSKAVELQVLHRSNI